MKYIDKYIVWAIVLIICTSMFVEIANSIVWLDEDEIASAPDDTITQPEEVPKEDTPDEEREEIDKTPSKHTHEIFKTFSFQFQGSTASNYVKWTCKSCSVHYTPTLFRGTPSDTSYLELIKKIAGEDEIIGGEYYTLTVVVAVRDFDRDKVRIQCKVRDESFLIGFSVEFREEFEDAVNKLVEGDEITFRGKLYEDGFGFTDSELIT